MAKTIDSKFVMNNGREIPRDGKIKRGQPLGSDHQARIKKCVDPDRDSDRYEFRLCAGRACLDGNGIVLAGCGTADRRFHE